MQGRIVKGIAGFYYVDTEDGILECRAKGIFRNQKVKPLVGDLVELEVLSQEEKEGSVISILPRKSELIRPAVANVDQALVIFALSRPTPNLPLLDRFLIMMKQKAIPTIICFNKSDMVSEEEREHFRQIYRDCGSKLLFISAKKGEGTDAVRDCLRGHMTTVAGPSGVGKSTLIDHLVPEASHGRDAALLNLLRTKVRETETVAAQVFITRSFEVLRPDILQALNRLSSTVYVMMILSVTKQPLTVKQIQQRLGETQ
mgnify:CR=1 FL=1